MTRKSEKIASLSISLLEPPRIQMTCNTSNFKLESFSPNINDPNYLHLPPPTPDFCLKDDKICYTDIPLYAIAIATNKNPTILRDCSVYGTVFCESKDIGKFSSTTIGLTDFMIQPNEQVFIPFQVKVPHLLSSISARAKTSRSVSCFNNDIGLNTKTDMPTKTLTVSSYFQFKMNETNQRMQVNAFEKFDVKSAVSLSYKFSNTASNKSRLPLFQVVLTNHYNTFIRNVEVQTMDPNPHSPIVAIPEGADNYGLALKRKKNGSNLIKLGDFVGPEEIVSGYVSYPDLFNVMEIYFSLPFNHFCYFTEPILASLGGSQNLNSNQSQPNLPGRQSLTVKDSKRNERSPTTIPRQNIPGKNKISQSMEINAKPKNNSTLNRPLLTIPPKSQLQSPNFQANLNKLPKAVQTLRPFSVQIEIINTNKPVNVHNFPSPPNANANDKTTNTNNNNNGIINGSVSLAESESIFLFGNNNLYIPDILPGKSYIMVINLIALKQGKFSFPVLTVRLNNYRNTQVDFDTGLIAIGCNE